MKAGHFLGRAAVTTSALLVPLLVVMVVRGLMQRAPNSATDPFRADAIPPDAPFRSLTYTVHTSLWWNDSYRTGLHMDLARLMSFTHVKQVFAWQDIEPLPEVWDFSLADRLLDELEARDLQVIARLSDAPDWAHPSLPPIAEGGYIDAPPDDLADYGEFCGRVAERYRGRIAGYQLWNEPNLAREWGNRTPDAAGYVALMRVCSQAIRAADPDAVLISAGLAPTGGLTTAQGQVVAIPDDVFLNALYTLRFQTWIDVVGAHAPGYEYPEYGPDDAERDGRGRWATFRRVEDLRRIMVAHGDAARQMAILEFGYTTDQVNPAYQWYAVDLDDQARHIVAAFDYAVQHWRPWVGVMTVIYLPDPMWTPQDEQYWWSIIDPTLATIRPAFAELARMPKYCDDLVIPARTPEEAAFAIPDNPCN